jgi:hypothetical protein
VLDAGPDFGQRCERLPVRINEIVFCHQLRIHVQQRYNRDEALSILRPVAIELKERVGAVLQETQIATVEGMRAWGMLAKKPAKQGLKAGRSPDRLRTSPFTPGVSP